MSQLCSAPICKSKSTILCYCCNKNVCIDHLREHDDLIKCALKDFQETISHLNNQWKDFDREKLIEHGREKLSQWKENCYRMIDDYYQVKYEELKQFSTLKFEQNQKEIEQIRVNIDELRRNEKVTRKTIESLKSSIHNIEREMKKFEEKGIQMDIRPFLLDNHSISIKDFKPNAFKLTSSNLLSPDRTINEIKETQSSSELVSNDRVILINLGEHLSLFDRDLTLIRRSPWLAECIYDMCWSATLSNFILITNQRKVYRINETTLAIDRVCGIEEKDWLSCTCSDTHLYLTTRELGTNIYQFKLLPLIRPVKQWIPPYSCKPYESIHDMQYNNGTIALIIRKSSGGVVDIELRSSATLSRIWSLPLDIRSSGIWSRISCRSLPYDEWLIVHSGTSRLFHINKDGMLQIIYEYQSKLNNATLFGPNTLVIHLGSKIHLHYF